MSEQHKNPLALAVLIALVAALSVALITSAQVLTTPGPAGPGNNSPKPIPLVSIDEEMGGYLKDAEEMIAKKEYARAIEILQALLNRTEQCFVPTSDPRRYVSLAVQTNRVIGRLPKEASQLYRSLYDGQAERLFRRGADDGDQAALGDLVRRFLHTSWGDDALNLLGAMHFDRGQFSQAARCWQDILAAESPSGLDPAVVLAKVAVAHHFAGESRRAAEAMKLLMARHAQAEALLAGKKQNVVAFAEKLLSSPPPKYVADTAQVEGWPSLAGSPDSVALMSPCRPTLSPRWTRPGGRLRDNPNVQAVLGGIPTGPPYASSGSRTTHSPALREGHVYITTRTGRGQQRAPAPAMIHPVVTGSTVLCRLAEGVVAYDLFTGEKLWASIDFPLYRSTRQDPSRRVMYYGYGAMLADTGMWTLTAADGKVFAVGEFPPPVWAAYSPMRNRAAQPSDSSVLAAFSVTGEGRLLWMIGNGEGSAEILRTIKFLTAPTCHAGRLYVVGEYLQAYHLLCLDAESGRLLWHAMVGQKPVPSAGFPYNRYLSHSRGSPPAVADGRVFATTNDGVVAAFEAEAGRALWAYQYGNVLSATRYRRPQNFIAGQIRTEHPPNPIIVTKGRAICLPADSGEVLALQVDSGQRIWSFGCPQRRHLAAVDDSRLLLSGRGVTIVDAVGGEELWQSSSHVKETFGRPAVMKDAILVSGEGEMIRISLADFSITRLPLVRVDGILGNLICVAGKLLAANAAGISAYFTYEDAREELTRRIGAVGSQERAELVYLRGMNAFNAGKPEAALPDLLTARQGARQASDGALLARAEQALYRTYISLGDRAADAPARQSYFLRARSVAYSDRSRAEMLVRLSKHYEDIGQFARATELAHQLTLEYPETDVADVGIGDQADPFVRDDPDTPRANGYELGHDRIRELIASHGQVCYARFDAEAKAKLEATTAAGETEPMLAITQTYRHSVWAPAALLLAAESSYQRALADSQGQRRQLLARADDYLGRVIREYAGSPLVPSAWFGLTIVRQERNSRIVWLALRGLEKLPTDARAKFAGRSGKVGEILGRFSSQRRPRRLQRGGPLPAIAPPLAPVMSGKAAAIILRGPDGEAVRSGRDLFLLGKNGLSLFDPAASNLEEALRWETALPVDANRIRQHMSSPWAYSLAGGLTRDGSVLAVITRGGFVGVDVKTGKVLWSHDLTHAAVKQMHSVVMADDAFVILTTAGEVLVLDKRTGGQLWKHRIPQTNLPWRVPPQIAGGVLLTRHGKTESLSTLFDMNTRKSLGTVKLGRVRTSQSTLTADGLLVVCDGGTLKLIEPVSGIDQEIWSVRLRESSDPSILAVSDTHVVLAPDVKGGLIELRSLADDGRVVQTFQTARVKGKAVVPVQACIVGDRLYVLGGSYRSRSHVPPDVRVLSYRRDPRLYAFDLTTGKPAWSAPVDLSPRGGGTNVHVAALEFGQRYICALSKSLPFARPATLRIIDSVNGAEAQKAIDVPGAPAVRGVNPYQRMLEPAPVMTKGRIVLDTPKSIVVYGKRD